jgi:glyceraldehyde 3-phosphate dehydrogenase
MIRVAVNGFGRIGRSFVRLAVADPKLEIVAINDIGSPSALAYLLRYDTSYGRARNSIRVEHDGATSQLVIDGRQIALLSERSPAKLPWRELDIDVAVEATGAFESYADAKNHIKAGAKRVVLAAPAKDEEAHDSRTILMGVNPDLLAESVVSSNGSCTTNSAASVIEVLRTRIGIRKAMLNTVHGYTASQSLVDGIRSEDPRRGRAAAMNIVPSSTGAAIAVTRAIPQLKDRFDGTAMRVPVLTGSLSVISFLAERPTSVAEINNYLIEAAAQPRWAGTLAVTVDPLVSSDIIGDPHGAIADLSLTKVVDRDFCSVYSWYDNEFGFASTLLAHVVEAGRRIQSRTSAYEELAAR